MKCDEIQEMLNEYVDGTLTADSKTIVDRHLATCSQCSEELQSLRLLLNAAKQLSHDIQPERDLWKGIKNRLSEPEAVIAVSPEYRKRKQQFFVNPFWRQPAVVRFGFAFAVLLVAVMTFWLTSKREMTGWEIAAVTGAPHLEEQHVVQTDAIRAGNVIVTDANSSALISNATIGNLRVEPNSRIRLLHADEGEHRFALDRGIIKASTWVPPRVFVVETPSAVAVDLGCEYRLMVDSAGSGRLLVTAGWVALEWKGKTSVVPSAAFCETRPGIGPGTPYSEYASDILRNALLRFDFSEGGEESLAIILSNARKEDAVTLWHLLGRVPESQRGGVYDRFASVLPPPDGVTRDGILHLDQTMLNVWWEEFELMPLSNGNPVLDPSSISKP